MSQTNGNIQIELISSTLIESMRDIIRAEFENHFSKPKEEVSEDGELLLTREQAMDLLHIRTSKLNQIQKSGELKYIKINRRILFRKSSIMEYLNRNTIN